MILDSPTQRNRDSREFGSASNVGFTELGTPFPDVPAPSWPHRSVVVQDN